MFAITDKAIRMLRSRIATLAVLGLAAASAACSGGANSLTSPSGVRPSDLAVEPSSARTFTVSVSPAEVTVGASTLTFTVTNTSIVDNPQTAALGSVRIVIPSGLTVTGIGSFAGSKPWTSVGAVGQTITVGTAAGNNKLLPGESVTFTVNITSTICGPYSIAAPGGSNDAPASYTEGSGAWQNTSGGLSVTVTGCTACDAPEAPSISHHYFTALVSEGGLGLPANDPRHSIVQVAVAHEQAEDKTFHGLSPCDPGFAAEVKAFVDQVMASL